MLDYISFVHDDRETVIQHMKEKNHYAPATFSTPRAPLGPLRSVVALLVLWQFSFSLLDVPRVRLFEKVICEQYYAAESHENSLSHEERCKVAAVQNDLALIAAYKLCLDGLPGMSCSSALSIGFFDTNLKLSLLCHTMDAGPICMEENE